MPYALGRILSTKKPCLKRLCKSLYNYKKSLKDDLDEHLLEVRDQQYLDQLLLKCKKEVFNLKRRLSTTNNLKARRISTEMENKFIQQLPGNTYEFK